MKIVIVDDNDSLRKVLRTLCEAEGHEIVADFGDGNGLLECVTQQRPDVVCLDYELPGKNGLELLVSMDTAANDVDVVMITGSNDPDLKGRAADLGAKGFIHKPFQQTQIIDELKDIAQTRAIKARAAITAESTVDSNAPATAAPPAAGKAETTVTLIPQKAVGVLPRSAVIVDDSGSIRLLLKGILEEVGIKVVGAATNGREGIDVVQRMHPALVCLDVDMPGMSGLDALPQMRAASPQTKIVMITGNAGRHVVEAAVAGGAKGYFLKPIRPAKVEEFLRKLLQI